MDDWQIVLLHTKRTTLLKRAFEAAFPGRVVSSYVPMLGRWQYVEGVEPQRLIDYFRRRVFDPGIWKNRVLTVYGDGNFHHYTYALTKLAAERRGLDDPKSRDWTYFHFDNHRDDWGQRDRDGYNPQMDCAGFVDILSHDHGAVPFLVGPDTYPKKDSRGYVIRGEEIPIYHNWFTKARQKSCQWKSNAALVDTMTGGELPSIPDLRETPTEAYLSFDLDYLAPSEIVTNYDQNANITVRRVGKILDRIRPFKRIFSADILGFPDDCTHPLSALTMIILARKIMGLGTSRLLAVQAEAKQKQATAGFDSMDRERTSPISEGELLEIVQS